MPRTAQLEPQVTRVLAPNPSAMTLDGTNTYLVGEPGSGEVAVVDPGPDDARHLAAVEEAMRARDARCVAVLVTHHHVDHVRSLPQVVRAGVPLVATAGTVHAAAFPPRGVEQVRLGRSVRLKGLSITPLAVSHDAAEPCGFHLQAREGAVTVVNDLGRPDDALRDHLAASDLIVLEANHDEAMLRSGPYPAHLKRRVLSPRGHLSNADCGRLLADVEMDEAR